MKRLTREQIRARQRKRRQAFWLTLAAIVFFVLALVLTGIRNRQTVPKIVFPQRAPEVITLLVYTAPEPEPIEVIADKPALISLGVFKSYGYCLASCGKSPEHPAYGITKSGTVATENRTIAVDPAVIPLGTEVYIDGQWYVCEDTGGGIKGRTIDVFYDSLSDAREHGVQEVEVFVYG